jgi:hypothetical protein
LHDPNGGNQRRCHRLREAERRRVLRGFHIGAVCLRRAEHLFNDPAQPLPGDDLYRAWLRLSANACRDMVRCFSIAPEQAVADRCQAGVAKVPSCGWFMRIDPCWLRTESELSFPMAAKGQPAGAANRRQSAVRLDPRTIADADSTHLKSAG